MKDLIIAAIILVIVALVTVYIVRAKKRGEKCIGCPYSKGCDSCNCNKKGRNEY